MGQMEFRILATYSDVVEIALEHITVYCLESFSIYHNPSRDPDNFKLMWFTVTLKTRTLLIGAIYRPPSASNEILDYLDRNTFSVMDEFGAQSVMLIGDFNVHHKEWLGSNVTDAVGRCALKLSNLKQLQQKPFSIGCTLPAVQWISKHCYPNLTF